MQQHPELWVSAGLASPQTDDNSANDGESHEQPQQSFMRLLQQ